MSLTVLVYVILLLRLCQFSLLQCTRAL